MRRGNLPVPPGPLHWSAFADRPLRGRLVGPIVAGQLRILVPRAAHRLFLFLPLGNLLLLALGGLGLVVHVPIVARVGGLVRWKFCPRCRAGLEVEDGARAVCPACGFRAYASSKPTACALCVDEDGRVLLARRAGDVFQGYWDLPGGFLDEGEHPLDAIRRELREETGLDVEPLDFLGVWMDRYGDDEDADATLNLYWTARVIGGEPEAADDVSELRWFAPDELPPRGELAFHIADVLSAWRKQHA